VHSGTRTQLRKLRWAFSNRVVAQAITVNEVGYFRETDWLDIAGHLRRVHRLDHRSLVLYVY
jgi:hypothetical protein